MSHKFRKAHGQRGWTPCSYPAGISRHDGISHISRDIRKAASHTWTIGTGGAVDRPLSPELTMAKVNRKGLIDPVKDFALRSLLLWRDSGRTDLEILAIASSPTSDVDAAWEAEQIDRIGHVYCRPADVKAHIRRLLAA